MTKFILILFIVITFCTSIHGQHKTNDIINVEVASLKYMILQNNSYIKEKVSIIFISIKDSTNTNTINDVIKNLNEINSPVKNINDFYTQKADERKDIKCIRLSVLKTHIFGNGRKAIVSCYCFIDWLTGYEYFLTLEKKRRKWIIIKSELDGIS